MNEPILSYPSDAAADRRALWWVVLATLALCGYMLAWSIGTLPVLGDEAQHHRRAQVYYDAGFPLHRATHDPAYPEGSYAGIRYYDSSLWHMGLALVWRIVGRPAFAAAQVYHLVYFFALAVFSYLTAAKLYGRRAGWWAWALAVTTPMNLLFGTVFYLEVPVLAFAAAAIYALVRGRAVLTGVALAGMFLTKAASAVVLGVPLIVAGFLWPGLTWRRRLLGGLVLLVVLGVTIAPDIDWRRQHFGNGVLFRDTTVPPTFQLAYSMGSPKQTAVTLDITNLYIDLKMFGVSGLFAAAAAILVAVALVARAAWGAARTWRSSGLRSALRRFPEIGGPEVFALAVPLLFYVAAFVLLLRRACDVRYFQPVMLFAAILSGGLLARRRALTYEGPGRRYVRAAVGLLILSMIGQGLTVPPYVRYRRTPSPEVLAAFQWIRDHTPESAAFLYLETNLVNLTGRPLIWGAVGPRYLFQVPDPEQMRLLCHYGVVYIAIHPTRRTDDFDPDVEPTAYPTFWVRSLAERPYLTRVYPEGDLGGTEGRFVIYRIDVDKIPKGWLEDPPAGAGNGTPAAPHDPPAPGNAAGPSWRPDRRMGLKIAPIPLSSYHSILRRRDAPLREAHDRGLRTAAGTITAPLCP